jgi:hypothetical protein
VPDDTAGRETQTMLVSDDGARAAMIAGFGVACYVRADGSEFRHVGLVRDIDTAEAWLAGGDVEMVRIYPIVEADGCGC